MSTLPEQQSLKIDGESQAPLAVRKAYQRPTVETLAVRSTEGKPSSTTVELSLNVGS